LKYHTVHATESAYSLINATHSLFLTQNILLL
jgi:hypothetical protein